jgi:hypothetical protein
MNLPTVRATRAFFPDTIGPCLASSSIVGLYTSFHGLAEMIGLCLSLRDDSMGW